MNEYDGGPSLNRSALTTTSEPFFGHSVAEFGDVAGSDDMAGSEGLAAASIANTAIENRTTCLGTGISSNGSMVFKMDWVARYGTG